MVERQLVELNVAGSNPVDHPKGNYRDTNLSSGAYGSNNLRVR